VAKPRAQTLATEADGGGDGSKVVTVGVDVELTATAGAAPAARLSNARAAEHQRTLRVASLASSCSNCLISAVCHERFSVSKRSRAGLALP